MDAAKETPMAENRYPQCGHSQTRMVCCYPQRGRGQRANSLFLPSVWIQRDANTVGYCPFWAAAPKGPMTYPFSHRGNFSFFSSFFFFSVPPLRLKSQPQGSNPSPNAQIIVSSLRAQILRASDPQSLNPSLKAQISACKLKY